MKGGDNMGTFSKVLKSKDGLIVGTFPNLNNLSLAHYEQAPVLSPNSFEIFHPYFFGTTGDLEWSTYYDGQYLKVPSTYTITDVALLLQSEGATTQGSAIPFYAISTTMQSTDICIIGYSDSATVVRFTIAKRVFENNQYRYTVLSTWQSAIERSGSDYMGLVAGIMTTGGTPFYAFGVVYKNYMAYNNIECQGYLFIGTDTTCQNVIGSKPDGEPVSPEYGPASKPDGGYVPDNPHGTFDFHSDEIPIDPLPTVGVTTAGFINVYKIEQNELQTLGEKLFPHFLPAELLTGSSNLDIKDVLLMFLKAGYGTLYAPSGTAIELNDNLGIFDIIMNGKLIDYVLDCHIIPTSISGGTTAPLKVGYREFNDIILAKATQDYVDVDCGALSIDECFGNFLDYSCKVEIYLPFVGFVNIPNEYWNNATVGVHYIFNIVDGSFQAKIISTRRDNKMELSNTVIGQYGGVCCVHFPITGLSYSNIVSGLVNGSLGMASKASANDTFGVATQASKMLSLRPEAPMSNGYNASSSFLAQRTPYLVIKYPASQFSELYPNEQGTPLNVAMQLSTLSGFTTIDNPVLNIQCSDEEYNEMVSLLKAGVIL